MSHQTQFSNFQIWCALVHLFIFQLLSHLVQCMSLVLFRPDFMLNYAWYIMYVSFEGSGHTLTVWLYSISAQLTLWWEELYGQRKGQYVFIVWLLMYSAVWFVVVRCKYKWCCHHQLLELQSTIDFLICAPVSALADSMYSVTVWSACLTSSTYSVAESLMGPEHAVAHSTEHYVWSKRTFHLNQVTFQWLSII